MQHLQPGTLLQGGKYSIVRHISSGGFGNTYEGLHVLLKKRVAIKEFFVKDFCNRDETTSPVTIGITSKTALVKKLKTKFLDEAQFVSTLKHPNSKNSFMTPKESVWGMLALIKTMMKIRANGLKVLTMKCDIMIINTILTEIGRLAKQATALKAVQ